MKYHRLMAVVAITIAILAAASIIYAGGNDELATVRRATAEFQRPEAAQDAGWVLVEGLDHCFEKPGVGAMGYHYINTDLLDLELDPLQPEAMVYESGPNGRLNFGAVEWIVPAEPWDAEHAERPSLLGHELHLNEELGVYVLHAWIWKHNPAGMFEDWNPRVSCP